MTARVATALLARYVVCAAGAATILFILFSVPIRIEYGLVSAGTGSRHEYTQWLLLLRSNERYTESPIETYLRESNQKFEHRWISYAGTGRNIFGMAVARSHGSPGAILDFSPYVFDYVRTLPPEGKQEIADVLNSADENRIEGRIRKLQGEFLNAVKNEN